MRMISLCAPWEKTYCYDEFSSNRTERFYLSLLLNRGDDIFCCYSFGGMSAFDYFRVGLLIFNFKFAIIIFRIAIFFNCSFSSVE